MTATAPCPRPRAPRLKSRLAAVLAVGSLIGGLSVAGATPASAAVEDAAATAELHVAVGTTGQIAADGPIAASVHIANTSETTLDPGIVTLELGRSPLSGAAAVEDWLDDGVSSADFTTIATAPTDALNGGDTEGVEVTAEPTDLDTLQPGVYPVRATLEVDPADAEAAAPEIEPATTVVIVPDGSLPRTAVLVPITATPLDGSLLTATELTTLTAEEGALTAQLDALSGTQAILAVDPAIIAAIRMLGTAAPESATAWLQRLESLPNERFLLQFGDADAAVQAHAGQRTLLTPGDLRPLLDPANFTAATPTPTPTPTPDAATADEAGLPDDASLTALQGARTDVLWPQADVTADDLATFASYLDGDVTTILPASSTSAGGDASAGVTVGEHDVLLTADAASARLSAAVQQADETARNRELAATIAHLALTDGDGPVVIGLDRSESRVGTSLRTALSTLSAPPIALDDLRRADAASLTATPDEARAATLTTLLDDEQRLVSFSSILDEPRVLLTPERIRVLRLIGVGVPPAEFTSRVLEHRSNTVDTLGAVGIQEPSAIQLFTAAAPLPVWIRNDLPWPVNVALATQPSDARLDVQPTTQVEALAASNTRVTVPVEARVASGDLRVDFRLYSPTGVPIGQVESADVTVRADWETIGLGILGGVIVLLLGFGIVRTVRRRRRDAAADGSEEPAETAERTE